MGRCLALRFDGSGARLAVMCESEVLLVDGGSLQTMLRVPSPYLGPMTALDLSADGRRLLTAGHDGELTVWDAGSASVVRRLAVKRSRRPHPPPPGVEPPEVFAVVLAPLGDRYGMRHIHVAGKASRALNAAPRAYHAVAIADDVTAFAAVTSGAFEGGLSYAVEVWRIAGP